MFHSILVPLDGSTLAEQALLLAAAVAEQNKASLSLAVVHPWGPAEDAPRSGTRADHELREAEGTYLNRLTQAWPQPTASPNAKPCWMGQRRGTPWWSKSAGGRSISWSRAPTTMERWVVSCRAAWRVDWHTCLARGYFL